MMDQVPWVALPPMLAPDNVIGTGVSSWQTENAVPGVTI
jgi:hypothetical protein